MHTENCISRLICFIICIKACNRTVSNLLIFRIPLLWNNSTTENSTKNDNNYNNKNRSSNFALKMYRNYLPKMMLFPLPSCIKEKGIVSRISAIHGPAFYSFPECWCTFLSGKQLRPYRTFPKSLS